MTLPGTPRAALRRMHESDEGVSLVEALVAVVILATAILALVATAATSTVSLRLSRDRQQATQTASAALEGVRNMSWDAIVLADSPAPAATFETEPMVTAATGPLTHIVTNGRFRTTLYVTWANDPTNTLKRVTAITAWEDRGQFREVRESTLVAIAERGLPVPNFLISPDTSAQQAVEGTPVCFTYSVVNLGEQDSYSFEAGRLDGSGEFAKGAYEIRDGRQGFKIADGAGGPWFVWGKLGVRDEDTNEIPLMVDATSDQRPDSAEPVERRDSVPVEFCAERIASSTTHSQTPTFTFRVYSAFDDTVLRDATGTVTTTVPTDRLYLVTGGNNQRTRFELTQTKPIRLDTSTSYDSPSDGIPGLRFRAGNTSDRANWDYQPGVSRIEGTATLTLFVANDDSLGVPDDLQETIGLQLRIEKLNSQRNTVEAVIISQAVDVEEPTSGWKEVKVTLAIPTTSFAPNEYLRVSLWDRSATDDDGATHVHFDVNEGGVDDDPASYGGTSEVGNERFLSNLDIRVVPQ